MNRLIGNHGHPRRGSACRGVGWLLPTERKRHRENKEREREREREKELRCPPSNPLQPALELMASASLAVRSVSSCEVCWACIAMASITHKPGAPRCAADPHPSPVRVLGQQRLPGNIKQETPTPQHTTTLTRTRYRHRHL